MIYWDNKENQFKAYSVKGTFLDAKGSGTYRTNYSNSKNYFTKLGKHGDISDMTITSNTLTENQENRLESLNKLKNKDKISASDARTFVETGFVLPDSELEKNIDNKYKEQSINVIKESLIDKIREVRKEKEAEGTSFSYDGDSLEVRTDPTTQSKITAAKMELTDPDSDIEEIDWELKPASWTKVDKEKVKLLSEAVSKHVQQIFSKSREQMEKIENCENIEDFEKLDIEWIYPKEVFPLNLIQRENEE